MNKDTLKLFISIIAGLGLGIVLTYAFNANATTNQLTPTGLWTSNIISDGGALFNNISTADKKVIISSASGNIGVGIGAVEPSYKLHIDGGNQTAIYGVTNSLSSPPFLAAIYGLSSSTVIDSYGVKGESKKGWGVYGIGTISGVSGYSSSANGKGVSGSGSTASGSMGVSGTNWSTTGYGIYGVNYASSGGYAGYFEGDVEVTGLLIPSRLKINPSTTTQNNAAVGAEMRSVSGEGCSLSSKGEIKVLSGTGWSGLCVCGLQFSTSWMCFGNF